MLAQIIDLLTDKGPILGVGILAIVAWIQYSQILKARDEAEFATSRSEFIYKDLTKYLEKQRDIVQETLDRVNLALNDRCDKLLNESNRLTSENNILRIEFKESTGSQAKYWLQLKDDLGVVKTRTLDLVRKFGEMEDLHVATRKKIDIVSEAVTAELPKAESCRVLVGSHDRMLQDQSRRLALNSNDITALSEKVVKSQDLASATDKRCDLLVQHVDEHSGQLKTLAKGLLANDTDISNLVASVNTISGFPTTKKK